jgi:hypothetical protein
MNGGLTELTDRPAAARPTQYFDDNFTENAKPMSTAARVNWPSWILR